MYGIVIYSPDQHIVHDARTPDSRGVGGGIMARIRLAQALARRGHRVTVIGNVPGPHRHRGVSYLPLGHRAPATADALLMMSSGGALSLAPAADLEVDARLRLVWVQGTIPIADCAAARPQYYVPASNFLHDTLVREWGVAPERQMVIYNGVPAPRRPLFGGSPERDPFSLIYTSHPSKGLAAALEVLRRLRREDPRFHLHVYGGDRLWGGKDEAVREDGVRHHGTEGQARVLAALGRASVSLNLQARLEPFGMVLIEAMTCGAIPIASPAGAYAELLRDGHDGFLVAGDPASEDTHTRSAEIVLALNRAPDFAAWVRRNARHAPWLWDNQAIVWEQMLDWQLAGKGQRLGQRRCARCSGEQLLAADGYHCLGCGRYDQGERVQRDAC